jgi:hypothetical protein
MPSDPPICPGEGAGASTLGAAESQPRMVEKLPSATAIPSYSQAKGTTGLRRLAVARGRTIPNDDGHEGSTDGNCSGGSAGGATRQSWNNRRPCRAEKEENAFSAATRRKMALVQKKPILIGHVAAGSFLALLYAPSILRYASGMDVLKMLAELRQDRARIEEAIIVLERLELGHGKRRGRPPAWMKAASVRKRRGRPPGSKNKPKDKAGEQR